jgi:hypothetical protein
MFWDHRMSSRQKKAQRLSMLMQRVGFALWQVQELENTAAGYIVVRLRETRGVGIDQGMKISTNVEGQMLGRLIGELAKAGVIASDLASRLTAFLKERNWLVHHSRRENRGVLSDDAMFAGLLTRLDTVAEDALALTKELGREMEEYVVSSGVSRDSIDREAERLSQSWGLTE